MLITKSKIVIPALIVFATGCASSGVNHRPTVSNSDIANYEVDLKNCQQQAANREDLDDKTEGGLAGAAAGALAGATGDGSDIIAGAVVGAIVGIAGGSLSTQKKQREFIIQCMQGLGYNVVADD